MPRPSEQIDRARLQQALQSILSQSMGMAQSLIEEQPPDEPPAANDQPVEVQHTNEKMALSRKLSKSLRGLAAQAQPELGATTRVGVVPHFRVHHPLTIHTQPSQPSRRSDVADAQPPADARQVASPPSADVEALAQRFPGINTASLVGLGDLDPFCDPIVRFILSGESFAQLQRLTTPSVGNPRRPMDLPRSLEQFTKATRQSLLSLAESIDSLGKKRGEDIRDQFSLASYYLSLHHQRRADRPHGLSSSVGGSREAEAEALGIKPATLSDLDRRGQNIKLLTGGHLGLLCLLPLDPAHRPSLKHMLRRGNIPQTRTMGTFIESNPFLVQLSGIIQREAWPIMSGRTSTLPPAISSLLRQASMWKPEQFAANLARQLGAIEGAPA
ncbi:hypothetical protein S7711_09662 [Stachybotrys chartarum IBT 7711]|uniref:Uncharacterized protein n=1 Tax=Stachybotrys chartarum (strain CBS 109288 / IBT 7711) TaxID=1280523 RepID=A0A084B7T4_STACB|nr:hypothetical protein S7711_09662 [Stachybotrys chartarum IBT 7711]